MPESDLRGNSPFGDALGKERANYVPLSPVQFLERSALVYPDKVAVRHGERAMQRLGNHRCRHLVRPDILFGSFQDTVAVLVMGTFMRAFGYFNIPRPWTIENWQRVLADPSLIKSLWNTLIVGLGTAVSGASRGSTQA